MSANFNGEKTSKNEQFTDEVGKNNVRNTIEIIIQKSAILKEMITKKEIRIIGAYYDIKTGVVSFLE